MLKIDRTVYAAIVAHARSDHPDEACGVVAGPAGTGGSSSGTTGSAGRGGTGLFVLPATDWAAVKERHLQMAAFRAMPITVDATAVGATQAEKRATATEHTETEAGDATHG